MNSISIEGRVVWDAQLETSQSGTDYCRARIASDVGFGERKKTLFLDAVLFGKRATALEPYLTKGQQVVVFGELEPARTYDANGETRIAQTVIVANLALVGGKPQDQTGTPKGNRNASGPPDFDDDIPF